MYQELGPLENRIPLRKTCQPDYILLHDEHLMAQRIIFWHTFVCLHLNISVQMLCKLLNIRLGWMPLTWWRRLAFEMVVGSLQRYLAISLKERSSFRESSINSQSSKVKCFWFPGIYLLMISPSTAVRRKNNHIIFVWKSKYQLRRGKFHRISGRWNLNKKYTALWQKRNWHS